MKLCDILAIQYNIDREVIKNSLEMYMNVNYLSHEQKVKMIHTYLSYMGYSKQEATN